VRVWAVPGKEQQLRVAHAAATGALRFFREWTAVAQPLKKVGSHPAVLGYGVP
jgi:hypothetical protein